MQGFLGTSCLFNLYSWYTHKNLLEFLEGSSYALRVLGDTISLKESLFRKAGDVK